MSFGLPRDCCGGLSLVNFSKVEVPMMENLDLGDTNLYISMATILFNPLYWNLVARWEYRTEKVSRFFKNKRLACSLLGISIFLLGIFRDYRYSEALDSQPRWILLQQNYLLWSGYLCIVLGSTFVVTSFLQLGFFGTFLGDYFGILMEARVTGFPFNVLENPMYWGSFLNFLGAALLKASQAGILLSVFVAICYKIAIIYEGPFTKKIYADNARRKDLNKMA